MMPTIELIAHNEWLQSQLAATQQREGRMRERLAKAENLLSNWSLGKQTFEVIKRTKDFLTDQPSDPQEPWFLDLKAEVSKFLETASKEEIMAALVRAGYKPDQPSDLIVVRREDLEVIKVVRQCRFVVLTDKDNQKINRLEAALEKP